MTTDRLLGCFVRSAPALAVCSVLCCLVGPAALGLPPYGRGTGEDMLLLEERDAGIARAAGSPRAAPDLRASTARLRCVPRRRDLVHVGTDRRAAGQRACREGLAAGRPDRPPGRATRAGAPGPRSRSTRHRRGGLTGGGDGACAPGRAG